MVPLLLLLLLLLLLSLPPVTSILKTLQYVAPNPWGCILVAYEMFMSWITHLLWKLQKKKHYLSIVITQSDFDLVQPC